MKKFVIFAVFFSLCAAFPTHSSAMRHSVPRFLNKETAPDMSQMNNICVG